MSVHIIFGPPFRPVPTSTPAATSAGAPTSTFGSTSATPVLPLSTASVPVAPVVTVEAGAAFPSDSAKLVLFWTPTPAPAPAPAPTPAPASAPTPFVLGRPVVPFAFLGSKTFNYGF